MTRSRRLHLSSLKSRVLQSQQYMELHVKLRPCGFISMVWIIFLFDERGVEGGGGQCAITPTYLSEQCRTSHILAPLKSRFAQACLPTKERESHPKFRSILLLFRTLWRNSDLAGLQERVPSSRSSSSLSFFPSHTRRRRPPSGEGEIMPVDK